MRVKGMHTLSICVEKLANGEIYRSTRCTTAKSGEHDLIQIDSGVGVVIA